MSKLQIAEGHVEEIKALLDSGDITFEEYRAKYEKIKGTATTLTDENLIRAIAATDDDDDELFVRNVEIAEAEQNETV
jgi:hypothetical protein